MRNHARESHALVCTVHCGLAPTHAFPGERRSGARPGITFVRLCAMRRDRFAADCCASALAGEAWGWALSQQGGCGSDVRLMLVATAKSKRECSERTVGEQSALAPLCVSGLSPVLLSGHFTRSSSSPLSGALAGQASDRPCHRARFPPRSARRRESYNATCCGLSGRIASRAPVATCCST